MIETDMVVGTGLRITVAKDDLVGALGVVARAVSTRTSVQILSGILLEAQGSELRLAATDMELSLRASVAAQIEGDGAIVLGEDARRHRAAAAGGRGLDRAQALRVGRAHHVGERELHAAHVQPRGLPALARA